MMAHPETLVNFYQTTRLYNPEDSHLRTHRRENLKSYVRRNVHRNIKRIKPPPYQQEWGR
jgi:hypothetical protein